MRPRTLAVVVTFNASKFISECLESLERQVTTHGLDVVVVDNGSSDDTVATVASRHPGVALVRSKKNLGFAGGVNLGIRHSGDGYEFVILLNSDAIAHPGFATSLIELMDSDRRLGAATGRVLLSSKFCAVPSDTNGSIRTLYGSFIVDPQGTDRLVNSTGNEVRTDGYGGDRGWLIPAEAHHPKSDDVVFGFSGSAAILRMRALEDVGPLDDSFFLYYEDTDLSWRLRLGGWKIAHCPTAVVDHIHSASSVSGSDLFRFYNERNRLLMLAKDATVRRSLRAWFRFPLTTWSLAHRRHIGRDLVLVRRRAYRSAWRMLPSMLRGRAQVKVRIPRATVEELLVPTLDGST